MKCKTYIYSAGYNSCRNCRKTLDAHNRPVPRVREGYVLFKLSEWGKTPRCMEIDEEYFDEILTDFSVGDRLPSGISVMMFPQDMYNDDVGYILITKTPVGASSLPVYDKTVWTVCTIYELESIL